MSLVSSNPIASSSGPIKFIAETVAKTGTESEVRSMLSDMALSARNEHGCEAYQLLEAKHMPGTFFTYEGWTSEEELRRHLKSIQEQLKVLQPMLKSEPIITVLNLLL